MENEKIEGEKIEKKEEKGKKWENIYFSKDVKILYGKELGWYIEIEFGKKGKKEIIKGIIDKRHVKRLLEAVRGILTMNEMEEMGKGEKEEDIENILT
jgi:hypothetical protein